MIFFSKSVVGGKRFHFFAVLAIAAFWTQPAAPQSLVLPAPVAAGTDPKPAFEFTPRGTVDFTFTDNVQLTNTNRKPDIILSPSVGFTFKDESARTTITVNSDVFYDKYKSTPQFDGIRATAQMAANVDVVENVFDISARAAIDQQQINPFGASAASPRTFGANQSQVLNYGATPSFRQRAGNFVNFETHYDIALVNYLQTSGSTGPAPASDSIQQGIHINAESGSYFDRLTWTAGGFIQRMDRAGPASAFNRRQIDASLLYEVYPNVQVVATGGYDEIRDASLAVGIDGMYYTGGLRWALSPRTRVTFDGGWRYGRPFYNGLITYGLGRAVALRASYSVTIETPQSLANLNLTNVVRDDAGNLINPATGLPADPNNDAFGLNNQVFRREAVEVGIVGALGRTTYSLNGTHERREATVTSINLRGSAAISRSLSPHVSATLSASYSHLSSGVGVASSTSEIIRGSGQLDYVLGRATTMTLVYYYQRTRSLPRLVRENAAVLKLTRQF